MRTACCSSATVSGGGIEWFFLTETMQALGRRCPPQSYDFGQDGQLPNSGGSLRNKTSGKPLVCARQPHFPPNPSMAVGQRPADSPPAGALLTAPGPTTGRPHFVGPTLLLPSSGVGLHAFVMFIAPILSSFVAHVRDGRSSLPYKIGAGRRLEGV